MGDLGPVLFDHRNPDYVPVFRERAARIARIRQDSSCVPALKAYYRGHIAQFIIDFGCTFDPRLVSRGVPALVPFVLFPKQVEAVDWIIALWKDGGRGLFEKSREVGASWLIISVACSLCLFNPGMAIGFGSRKEMYVDELGSPKSLFEKGRIFLENLPVEFRGGWTRRQHSPHLRMMFPHTRSIISGEAGDNIGRGDRTGIYFVDEAAFLSNSESVDAALSQTTNTQIDVSSPNGRANPFAEKRFSGRVPVFTLHWRDDPRKDDAWYEQQVRDFDPVIVAREIDLSYTDSVENILIPSRWVNESVDAHKILGLEPRGERGGALDIADQGKDTCAFVWGQGCVIEDVAEWSGAGSDIYESTLRCYQQADLHRLEGFRYDADGLGAGVRAACNQIARARAAANRPRILIQPFQGSGKVRNPTKQDVQGRMNADMFLNTKAQAWWNLRQRFEETFKAVVARKNGHVSSFNPDRIVSLSSSCSRLVALKQELSQPSYTFTERGLVKVNKAPDNARSPNLADAVMIRCSGSIRAPMVLSSSAISRI